MKHIRSQSQLFQLVKRAKREALGTCEFRKSFGTVAATIDGVGHHSCSKRPPTAAVVRRGLRGFSDGLRDDLAPFSV
jgi:hypothetical protein